MKIEVHDRLDDVGAVTWSEVHASSRLRAPFLTFTWQQEWVRAFAASRRLEIRTVQDDAGRVVAILPLYEVEPGLLRLIGGVDVSDYLDLLVRDGRESDAWTALLQSRTGDPAVWDLHAIPGESPTIRLLSELAGGFGFTVTDSVEERCPVLDLPGSWDAYLERLSSRHRHELQRKLRRFQREAPDGRATCARRPDEIETRFGDFLDLHRRSRVGKARFMDATMEAFFRRVVVAFAGAGGARVWFLDTARGPIASFVTLEWDGTVGLYNSGFHPESAALSPGLVLLAHLVQDAIVRGKRRFDFLRGEERYKYEFGPTPEDVHAIRVAPAGGAA